MRSTDINGMKSPGGGVRNNGFASSQQGIALVISLVLLLAMTIVGVATLSGTRLNELIASNAQQASIAFEAAESAIESASDFDDLLTAINTGPGATANNPAAVQLTDAQSNLAQGYDVLYGGKGVDISGTLTVQYCGEVAPIGTNINAELGMGHFVTVLVDINSQVDIANSSASADHLRRVSFPPVPQTGRTGNCTVRY